MFRRVAEMQHRLYMEAMKAKGRELCALVDAFERLENLKRLMKGLPSPDALVKVGRNPMPSFKSRSKKVAPFPEPIEPDGNETADREATPGQTPGTEVDREGISFGMDG